MNHQTKAASSSRIALAARLLGRPRREPVRVRAEKAVMASTMWMAGSVAAVMGWVGLEVAVGLWISAHRVTIVALAAVIAVHAVALFAFLGLKHKPPVAAVKKSRRSVRTTFKKVLVASAAPG